MARESTQTKQARASKLAKGLAIAYPDAHCELNYSTPLELLIATILSAQTTDKQVNVVTRNLFLKYRTAPDYARASLEELQNDLKAIGLFRAKARSIKNCCQALVEKHQGEVPRTMEDLTELAGVGRKTANVVLGNAFQINEGVVVDTHVARLSQRLGLSSKAKPEEIENDLRKLFPREQWTILSHWLIWHGRRRCSARRPNCASCELREDCPSRDKFGVP